MLTTPKKKTGRKLQPFPFKSLKTKNLNRAQLHNHQKLVQNKLNPRRVAAAALITKVLFQRSLLPGAPKGCKKPLFPLSHYSKAMETANIKPVRWL